MIINNNNNKELKFFKRKIESRLKIRERIKRKINNYLIVKEIKNTNKVTNREKIKKHLKLNKMIKIQNSLKEVHNYKLNKILNKFKNNKNQYKDIII